MTASTLSRIPPHNLDAEQAILGAVLLEGGAALSRIAPVLRPVDFYTEAHREIYAAMLALGDRREPVDLITLQEELRRTEQVEFIGGPAKLAILVEQGAIAGYLDHYVRMVGDTAIWRELLATSFSLQRDAFEATDDPDAVLEAAEVHIRELRTRRMAADTQGLGLRSLGDVLDTVITDLKAGRPKGMIGTPFPSVNQLLAGGFLPGELILFGGYAGFGKTAMALEQVTASGRRGDASIVISREMLNEALARRILSQASSVPASALRSGNLDEARWALIDGVLPSLRNLPVWMTDRVGAIAQIAALVRLGRERHGIKVLVVDYLQLIRGPRGVTEKRLEVDAVSRGLKEIATEHRIVVIAISAMSRRERGAANRRPTVSDLRESGQLEHDADVILLGWRPDNTKRETELIVAKGRGNKTGTVELLFFGDTLTFEEKSDRQPGDETGQDEVPF